MKAVKFYNRQKEIATLKEIEQNSSKSSQMTIMVGRRRVGKTTLLKRAFEKKSVLYFFVAKKNEVVLCEDFSREVEDKLGGALGGFENLYSRQLWCYQVKEISR